MMYGESFTHVEDIFCQAVLAYADQPDDEYRRQYLYRVMNMLTLPGFLSQVDETHDTRLFYMIKCFFKQGILQDNMLMICRFLRRCDAASNQVEYDTPPVAFQLFAHDNQGENVCHWAYDNAMFKLVALFHEVCDTPAMQGMLKQSMGYETAKQELIDIHLDLLQWELSYKRISADDYIAKHAALLKKLEQQVDLEGLYTYHFKNKARLLDRLLQPECNPHAFHQALRLLNKARDVAWISPEVYLSCLVDSELQQYSLLHELLYRGEEVTHPDGDVKNVKSYLAILDALRAANILTHDAYLAVFTQVNTGGYSGVHQAMNAPNMMVARAFMTWFDRNSYFSNDDKLMLLRYKNPDRGAQVGARRAPSRRNKDGMREVNGWLRDTKKNLHDILMLDLTPKVAERGRLGFHALEVDMTPCASDAEVSPSHQDFSRWTPTSFLSSTRSSSQDEGASCAAFSPAGSL